ncbi:MAG: hypothetical protein Q4B07_00335 [Clostridia bacterium]|nr:hypothetical protein [Clostridia bacterium]
MKKVRVFSYIVVAILILSFVFLGFLSGKNKDIDFVSSVAGVSSFFVAICTAINIFIVSKQIDTTSKQLEEMQKERETAQQPLLVVKRDYLEIDKPRLFYTPPSDEYSFLSRYHYSGSLYNASSFPAVEVDICAELSVFRDDKEYKLQASTRQMSVLIADEERSFNLLFTGDERAYLFDSLRELRAERLPVLSYVITFKNLCGGYFIIRDKIMLVPNDVDKNTLIQWHSAINKAKIETKEVIEYLKVIKNSNPKLWEEKYGELKTGFDKEVGEETNIIIDGKQLPNNYSFNAVSQDDYDKEKEKHQYGKFVHKLTSCK